MPLPIRMSAKVLNPFSSNLRRKHRPKSVPPEANSLVANIDTALVQQVFQISKRKWITHIHHHRQADDFGRRLEILEWVAFYHPATLICRSARLNQFSSDSARKADLVHPRQKGLLLELLSEKKAILKLDWLQRCTFKQSSGFSYLMLHMLAEKGHAFGVA